MQGVKVEIRSEDLVEGYQILAMDFRSLDNYHTVLWTGNLDDKRLIFRSTFDGNSTHNLQLSNALVMNHDRDLLFACTDPNSANVSLFQLTSGYSNCSHFHKDVGLIWKSFLADDASVNKKGLLRRQPRVEEEESCPVEKNLQWKKCCDLTGEELLLQLRLSETENHLLGTTALGFCVWKVADLREQLDGESRQRIDLKLPPGVRNISVKLLHSNGVILSKEDEYALAGVR